MKRFLFLTIACLFSICGMAQIAADTYVEVLYFHGKQRCVTCKAIEKYTKEVVNADLAELVKNGKLRFKEVDISSLQSSQNNYWLLGICRCRINEMFQWSAKGCHDIIEVIHCHLFIAV